jgi:hypothetical protein
MNIVMTVDDDNAQDTHGEKLADSLLRIGRDCAANLKEPCRSTDHGTILYDDQGLPAPRQ